MAALSRKGLQGRRAARHPGRLRRVVPGRDSRPLQSPPSAGRSRRSCARRSTELAARSRPARSNWRWSPIIEGLMGLRAVARGAARLGRRRTVPRRGGGADSARARQRRPALAARGRGGAGGGAAARPAACSSPRTSARSGPSLRRARGDDPARVAWSGHGLQRSRARRGPAGTAPDPHGPHPRARDARPKRSKALADAIRGRSARRRGKRLEPRGRIFAKVALVHFAHNQR